MILFPIFTKHFLNCSFFKFDFFFFFLGKEESFEKYAKRHYKPVPFSLYRDMMNIMFGSCGRGLIRVFNLSEGCFNENFDLGFYLYVGENAALYEIVYYEL